MTHGSPSARKETAYRSGGAKAYLCGSSRKQLYDVGDEYSVSGNGPVSGPYVSEKFGSLDRSLFYAEYEIQRDQYWAGHDKLVQKLEAGDTETLHLHERFGQTSTGSAEEVTESS